MDFSSLLLVGKGEWSHTGMDEILLCVMKWGWRNRAGKPPPELSIPLKAWSLLSFTVGAGDGGADRWQYYEQGSSQRMGHSYPRFSSLGLHWCQDWIAELRNPSNYGFSQIKWKLHTMDTMSLTWGHSFYCDWSRGPVCQDMTTGP